MSQQDRKPDIFIDAFTGGGKMGLSVPEGWYDTVVINDINWGVYNYFYYCKNNYTALIYMIEKIGASFSKDMFHLSAYLRSISPSSFITDENNLGLTPKDTTAHPLVAAALTYWVTASSFNAITDPKTTSYNIAPTQEVDGETKVDKAKERVNKDKMVAKAKRNIPKIHEKMNRLNVVVENMDYRELIKKYNGLPYKNLVGESLPAIASYSKKNKLWYFDPPYCEYALYGAAAAPYADTFDISDTNEMTSILNGSKKHEYGNIDFFIKSDYDPRKLWKGQQTS